VPQIGENVSEPPPEEEEGEKWEVQLLGLDGKPIGGKEYELEAPVEDSGGSLSMEGKTDQYSEPIPGDIKDIKVLFGLTVLPDIDTLFANYPTGSTDSAADTGVPYDIGGEVEQTYNTEMDDRAARGLRLDEGNYYNTCVIRTSVAFNAAAHNDEEYIIPRDPDGRGHGIPRGTLPSGKLRRLAGDKKWPNNKPYAYAISAPEFEPYLAAAYSDAPKLSGTSSSNFAGKSGVIVFVNYHVDIMKNGVVRYNDVSGSGWPSGKITFFQHVVIKPKEKKTETKNGQTVHTFVFEVREK